jgi:type II secretory pathway pseudopilin PulG
MELAVVVVVVGVLAAALITPLFWRATKKAQRISCINNLKEIGMAYRLWSGDHDDLRPAEQTISNGGWKELLTNADQGPNCWTNYALMSNEFGTNTRVLVCTADERKLAKDFKTDFKDNTHLSYFVGVSANDTFPQSIQAGDRNLGYSPEAFRDYGFSPENGKGNDVAVQIDSLSKPVSWSLKMHSASNSQGAGYILLGDGSAQQASSASFRTNWLSHADPTTNWPAGHIPSSPSIRLVFP